MHQGNVDVFEASRQQQQKKVFSYIHSKRERERKKFDVQSSGMLNVNLCFWRVE